MIRAALCSVGFVIMAWESIPGSVDAQDLAAQQMEALKAIRETAADICYTVQQKGQESSTALSGEVNAKLNGIIARVADLGVTGSGQLKNEQYQGVVREELATTLKQSADCRKDVFDKLVEKMLPSISPTGRQSPSRTPRALTSAEADASAIQGLYQRHKRDENTCTNYQALVEEIQLFVGNQRIAPDDFQYSVRRPSSPGHATISDLAADRIERIRSTKPACF